MTVEPVSLVLEKNVTIPARDGTELRADVFRPHGSGRYPVIMSYGPYGKDIHFKDFHSGFYETVAERGEFMNWETVNPEWWVPQGYVVVRVDERGTGCSPGRMDVFSRQEREDYYDTIEWAGVQSWSNGRVGLIGVSYYAILQWHVAALHPPHLAAIVPWEGANDLYREFGRHGGILNDVWVNAWWKRQVTKNQHAVLSAAGSVSGDAVVGGNVDVPAEYKNHELIDEYHEANAVDLAAIEVPVLSAGNWGGYALHLRGNIEGYLGAGSKHKWLEMHSGNHLAPFYTQESRELQKRFLDQWLTDSDSGQLDEPAVKLAIRTATGSFWRHEQAWPIPDTKWTSLYLDAAAGTLSERKPELETVAAYKAPTGGAVFLTDRFTERTEITGPMALHLSIASSVEEMDLFVSVICLDEVGAEVTCDDVQDHPGPIAKGWLRTSHRQLDEQRSTDYHPVHTHRTKQPLTPGAAVDVVVEILPGSMVYEPGFRLGVVVEAHDRDDATTSYYGHADPDDRAPIQLAGTNTILSGPSRSSYLVLPVIPPRPDGAGLR